MGSSTPMVAPFSMIDPEKMYGVRPTPAIEKGAGAKWPSIGNAMGPGADDGTEKPWHPDNPLFWFAAIAAVTFGLVGLSTSVRLGPFKAAASAGKT